MKRKIKKYLFMLIAAAALFGGMRMPLVVKAQEDVQQTKNTRSAEGTGATVTSHEELMAALAAKKSPITVQGIFAIKSNADTDGRMLPIKIPGNTVIQGAGDAQIISRSPIQLEGDGVCFQNIGLVFNSSDELHSVPHREIFLAGYSLTLDNVRTYLEGGVILDGTEEELLPTVYAGGYTNTSIGDNASLTVRNSNAETMFQAIYMGHDQGDDKKVSYNGAAVLNLDDKVTVRENIETSCNSKAAINISGGANQAAQAKKFYGDENTTLTINSVLVDDAELDNIGNVVLQNGACLSPKTESLCNVTLQNGACLNFNGIRNAVVTGDFTGETDAAKEKGILVLNQEGTLTIGGNVTGTTQFQTYSKLFPGTLFQGRTYIYALAENVSEQNFVLAQKKIDEGYELSYGAGEWSIAGEPVTLGEIGRIDILSAPSRVDLRKIAQTEDGTIPDKNTYFEIQWYDTNENVFSSEDVEYYMLYEMDYVIGIRTDYWKSAAADVLDKTDWHQWVFLESSENHPGRYYLWAHESAMPGDYTFLFCSEPYEGDLDTVADVKALKDKVMAERQVVFYDGDTGETEKPEPEEPEHTHSYKSEVTKEATCTEKGIRTYTCSCGSRYTEELALLSHKYVSKVSPATVKTNGKIQQSCQVCSAAGSASVIYKPQKLTLNKADFSYDGKVKTPSVTVKDSQGKSLKKVRIIRLNIRKGERIRECIQL